MVSPEYDAKLKEVTAEIVTRVQAHQAKTAMLKTPTQSVILPTEPAEAMQFLAKIINDGILDAKNNGVSPEKIAPLYNALKGVLEVGAELKGTLDRSNKTLIYNKVCLMDDVEELAMEIAQLRLLNQPMRIES